MIPPKATRPKSGSPASPGSTSARATSSAASSTPISRPASPWARAPFRASCRTNLSPASVRNVMMDLEDAGLIFSPHTSAGRVPTEQGLRFFVDAVMEVGAMSTDERARIDAQIAASNRQRRIEDVLGEATTLLSGLSHCAGVIVAPKINARLKHIEFVNLGPGRALVILVGEDGSVENRVIEVPRGLPPSTFTQASNYLSTRFQGKTIDEVQRFVRDEMQSLRARARRDLGPHRRGRHRPVVGRGRMPTTRR